MRSCKILARSVETLRQYSKFSLIIKEEAHADALASKRTIKNPVNLPDSNGGRSGVRTLGPTIKSRMLYQLS